MPSHIAIDDARCLQRIQRLYALWRHMRNEEDSDDAAALHLVDAIVFFRGQNEEISSCSEAATMQIWLFGYEWQDILIVFCQDSVTILASANTVDQLKQIARERNATGIATCSFHFLILSDDNEKNFTDAFHQMKRSFTGKTLGTFSKDRSIGAFAEQWQNHLDQQAFATVDISASMASLLSVKDERELAFIRRACTITGKLYVKYLKDQIVQAVDSERKIRHLTLSDRVQSALSDETFVPRADFHDVQMCYPAIIQSGGSYNLKFSIPSDRKRLHCGGSPIICALGVRYKCYCSNLVRTLLVNPSEEMKNTYDFLIECEELLMQELKHGVRLCDVHKLVREKVEKERPQLANQLTDNFGTPIGIAFQETTMAISSHCTAKAKKGMTFQVSIGFSGVSNPNGKDAQSQTYALFVGDTVLVNENQPCTSFTSAKKDIRHIGIISNDDAFERDKVKKTLTLAPRRAALMEQSRTTAPKHSSPDYQKALLRKINERAEARFTSPNDKVSSEKARSVHQSYKTEGQLPEHADIHDLKLHVDQRYETVLLPIHGAAIPFHISVIKNVSLAIQGEYIYLRVNFFHPTVIGNQPDAIDRENVYVKELTYRASNEKKDELAVAAKNLSLAHKLILETQKKYKDREQARKQMQDAVQQASLVLNPSRTNPKLKDVSIRPGFSNKKVKGTLEAHTNGFRYASTFGDRIDILYSNVAHAFYQSCDNETIILLHLHLKHAIAVGKRQQADVQFYAEVGESAMDLAKHRNMRDRESIQAEQAERELRNGLKGAFEGFIAKLVQEKHFPLEFERPFRPLGFHGAPHQSMVLIVPTTTCVVQLTEWPPLVMALDDIELVHFERVSFQTKTFDMVCVMKDYSQKTYNVHTISMTELDRIKHWLSSCEICFTEGPKSLNWSRIMKAIVDDPREFFINGGWKFLETDDDNTRAQETAEDSDAEEDDYLPDDEEEDEDDEDGSECACSDQESESDMSNASESDDESGKSWSELEGEAKQADTENFDEEFDDSRRNKKTATNSGTPLSKKRPASSPPSPNNKRKM